MTSFELKLLNAIAIWNDLTVVADLILVWSYRSDPCHLIWHGCCDIIVIYWCDSNIVVISGMTSYTVDVNVNVNWYVLMEPSRKSHAIELMWYCCDLTVGFHGMQRNMADVILLPDVDNNPRIVVGLVVDCFRARQMVLRIIFEATDIKVSRCISIEVGWT